METPTRSLHALPIAADKTDTLFVNELFTDTCQGEGLGMGLPASFIRLHGCDLHCTALPCDTPYTWKPEVRDKGERLTVEEILSRTPKGGTVVLTGGEPLLQQRRPAFKALIESLIGVHRARVEVETAGHHVPEPWLAPMIAQWNVSPKFVWSGNSKIDYDTTLRYYHPTAPAGERGGHLPSVLKFVVSPRPLGGATLDEQMHDVHGLVDRLGWPRERVVLQPEGVSPRDQLNDYKLLLDWQQRHTPETGFRILPRLHVLLWGNERGR